MRSLLLALLVVISSPLLAAPAAKPSTPLPVTVIDAETGKPVAGAIVSFARFTPRKTERIPTDGGGKATVHHEPGSNYFNFNVRADGYVPTFIFWNTESATPDLPAEYMVKLIPGKTIGGVVVDADGKPVA